MRHAKPTTTFRQQFWGIYQERLRALPRYGGKLETSRDIIVISVVGTVAILILVTTATWLIF